MARRLNCRSLPAYLSTGLLALGCSSAETQGRDGTDAVMLLEDEPKGTNCPASGTAIYYGADRNENGALDEHEIEGVQYLCAGQPGESGPSGEQGDEGDSGQSGVTGPSGSEGSVGETNDGPAGAQGPDGAVGATGVEGTMGADGPAGEAGASGPPGMPGPTGAVGSTGGSGLPGTSAAGATGATGSTGPEGPLGQDGSDGPDGLTGPVGPAGPDGPPGATGQAGPAGSSGATGPEGPGGAEGATGMEGATGTAGPSGATGSPGEPGRAGEPGATGAVGATGTAGATGSAGATGATGSPGATGSSGRAGSTGPRGATGSTGIDGILTLIDSFEEPAGKNCSAGGYRVTIGLDDGGKDGGEDGIAGDQILQTAEIDQTAFVCNRAQRTVFVTRATYRGDLNGLSGADRLCQKAAADAGLSGTFFAWLSSSSADAPLNRFVQSSSPYVLVSGAIIAKNWDDLVDGDLSRPISLDETGEPVSGFVWTNVTVKGSYAGRLHCDGWTSQSDADSGLPGESNSDESEWTEYGKDLNCVDQHHLYCFEQ